MAGLSSRFTKAGFSLPKYMLYVYDKSLFRMAVESFKDYFQSARFVFVARDVMSTQDFIKSECKLMGISNYEIVMLQAPTEGQAETVKIGIEEANVPDDESILIFNIDTFRPGFRLPKLTKECDGYLECFEGDGDNWSYARTHDNTADGVVLETAEKRKISNFCSTGIYWFKEAGYFMHAYMLNNGKTYGSTRELYVAPLYNILIHRQKRIRINLIKRNEVIFCGTPQEYKECLKECL